LAELDRGELMTLRTEDFLAAARAIGEEPEAEKTSFWRRLGG
jgi:ABC-type dipeptide/oligopeptide/nickel transport system permease subunit